MLLIWTPAYSSILIDKARVLLVKMGLRRGKLGLYIKLLQYSKLGLHIQKVGTLNTESWDFKYRKLGLYIQSSEE